MSAFSPSLASWPAVKKLREQQRQWYVSNSHCLINLPSSPPIHVKDLPARVMMLPHTKTEDLAKDERSSSVHEMVNIHRHLSDRQLLAQAILLENVLTSASGGIIRRQLATGEGGVGKSVHFNILLPYLWASESLRRHEDIALCFVVSGGSDQDELEEVLKSSEWRLTAGEWCQVMKFVQKFSKNVLVIIDNFERHRFERSTSCLWKLFLPEKSLSLLNIVVVGRPCAATFQLVRQDAFERRLLVAGFSAQGVEKFVQTSCRESLRSCVVSTEKGAKWWAHIHIAPLAHNPLILSLLCQFVVDDKLPQTYASLFSLMMYYLKPGFPRGAGSESEFSLHSDQRPLTLAKEDFECGRMALESLKDAKRLFLKSDIPARSAMPGFLTALSERSSIVFRHSSFQEVLAALYAAELVKITSGLWYWLDIFYKPYTLRQLIKEYTFDSHMHMFWIMLSGMLQREQLQVFLREICNLHKRSPNNQLCVLLLRCYCEGRRSSTLTKSSCMEQLPIPNLDLQHALLSILDCVAVEQLLQDQHSNISTIVLSLCCIYDSGFQQLSSLPHCNHLKELNISYNLLTAKSALLLTRVLLRNKLISKVDLSGNVFGNKGAGILLPALAELHCCEILNLRGWQMTEESAAALSDALLELSSMVHLVLDENDIGKAFPQLLDSCGQLYHMATLSLAHCQLTSDAMGSLSSILQSLVNLQRLSLDRNNIQDVGYESLRPGLLGLIRLQYLSMSSCDLTKNIVSDVLSALPQLLSLNLSGNLLEPAAVDHMVSTIVDHKCCRHVVLAGCTRTWSSEQLSLVHNLASSEANILT